MASNQNTEFDRELTELRERMAQRESAGPVSSWSMAERAASREDAQRVKRLMQFLIAQSQQSGSAG
jgi:hypothetical protein